MVALTPLIGGALHLFWNSDDTTTESKTPVSLNNEDLPLEDAQITFAPNVPPPITRKYPVKMKVEMVAEVKELPIDPVNKYIAWTFNGDVPGPFIRARVGDVLQMNLTNRDANGSYSEHLTLTLDLLSDAQCGLSCSNGPWRR